MVSVSVERLISGAPLRSVLPAIMLFWITTAAYRERIPPPRLPPERFFVTVLWEISIVRPSGFNEGLVRLKIAPPSASLPDVELPEIVLLLTVMLLSRTETAPPVDPFPDVEFSESVLSRTITEPYREKTAPPLALSPVVEFFDIVLWLIVNLPKVE
jgi:hypothetical protein